MDFFEKENAGAPVLEPRHVPEAIWAFAADNGERMGIDPTCLAVSALACCASVLSDNWRLQPKQHDDEWTESPRLWVATIGEPGVKKTPALRRSSKPIDDMDAAARERHRGEMAKWHKEEAAAKEKGEPIPPRPRMARHLVEDTTIEAFSDVMRDDEDARYTTPSGKVLCRHDEMAEYFGNLDRYKTGGTGSGDRGAYLRLYNGGRYVNDRVGRGGFAASNWSACFLGGIQPDVIQNIARKTHDDGLLQRFIFCVPDREGPGDGPKARQGGGGALRAPVPGPGGAAARGGRGRAHHPAGL